MRQRRPADPTDPGDAADLSIMGFRSGGSDRLPRSGARFVKAHLRAEDAWKSILF